MDVSRAALIWSALHVLTKERYDALLAVFGGLDEALMHMGEGLLRKLGCREETARQALLKLEEFDAESYAARLKKGAVRFLELCDPAYPSRLKEIGDPPPFLYAKGDLSLLAAPTIAVVGTREMSMLGRRLVATFVPPLVRSGLTTVSGLALGIDAEVAKETIAASGRTVAVLGHGMAMVYPKSNAELAKCILAKGGLILSEFPLDYPPEKHTFPSRNRIIAGLTLGTLVMEAPPESGSIITAELALEYGRDVFAVPGSPLDPHFAGCNQLIGRGQARLVTSPAEVLEELGMEERTQPIKEFTPEDPVQAALLRVLSAMPQKVDILVQKSKLDPASTTSALTMLELEGVAKCCGEGMWVRA